MRVSNAVPMPVVPGWYPGDPGLAGRGPEPIVDELGHAYRASAINQGAGPMVPIEAQHIEVMGSWPVPPAIWTGPQAHIGRQFRPQLRGDAGGMSHGGTSLEGDTLLLHVAPINWAKKQSVSVRSVSQPLNATSGGVGVPAVFVPSSATNFYGQAFASY